MATIQELSKRCGVSVSTVSKALNGYADISERTKRRVLDTAREIGYFPNSNARALKLKKTYNIGVFFQTHGNTAFRNDYFAYVFSSFREVSAQRGYDITFIEHNIGNMSMTHVEHCNYRNFDGVCIINDRYHGDEMDALLHTDIPCVTIDYPVENINSVLSDNYAGMTYLVQHVIDKGHRDIAYIYGEDCYVSTIRKQAFLDTLEANNIPLKSEYFLEGRYRKLEVAVEKTEQLLSLNHVPTCILAPDDHTATGVANAIYNSTLSNDISIAGFDGLYPCYVLGKRLTTMQQNTEQVGELAAIRLIEQIEHNAIYTKNHTKVQCMLVEGESVYDLR